MREFTTAERTMFTALACEVATARLARAEMSDSDAKGRQTMRVPGPMTEAEVCWFAMMDEVTAARRAEVVGRLS